jgi:uncharacterized membrane protein
MNKLINLIKLMLQGGLLVLLPLLLFILLMDEVIGLVVVIAKPLAEMFPGDIFAHAKFPLILALLLLAGASLLIGVAMRSSLARRLGSWLERNTFGRLPMYQFVKSLTTGLIGADQTAGFKPAWLVSDQGEKEFAYVIEDHGNGDLTVLLPWAPTAFSGSVKIVAGDRIRPIDASLGEVTKVLGHLGVGAQALNR